MRSVRKPTFHPNKAQGERRASDLITNTAGRLLPWLIAAFALPVAVCVRTE